MGDRALRHGAERWYASGLCESDRQGALDSLKKIREADKYANRLLAVAPDAADAYLGLGTANYVIGSLPGIKKFFLGFAGITETRKQESSNRRLPPSADTTCGRLRKFYWRWRLCARKRRKWLAYNLQNSSRNSPKTHFF